jgi:hypothetical protein
LQNWRKKCRIIRDTNAALEQNLMTLQQKYDSQIDANNELREEVMKWQTCHE